MTTSIITPPDIVTSARSWIDTRFTHQGRLKKTHTHKGGVDCLGLLIGVASELGLQDSNGRPITSYDNTQYTHAPDTTQLRYLLRTLLTPKPTQELGVGDVALFAMQGNPQHLAIISNQIGDTLHIIHSYAQARKVVEHELDTHWRKSLVAGYSII